jgi:hypothetical protein
MREVMAWRILGPVLTVFLLLGVGQTLRFRDLAERASDQTEQAVRLAERFKAERDRCRAERREALPEVRRIAVVPGAPQAFGGPFMEHADERRQAGSHVPPLRALGADLRGQRRRAQVQGASPDR